MSTVSLTSTWFIKPGCRYEALEALHSLVPKVLEEEGTLMYLVHTPHTDHLDNCRPLISDQQVLFVEMYRDWDAFQDHFNGDAFQDFLKDHGHLFVQVGAAEPQTNPYTTVRFLTRQDGFIKDAAIPALPAKSEGETGC